MIKKAVMYTVFLSLIFVISGIPNVYAQSLPPLPPPVDEIADGEVGEKNEQKIGDESPTPPPVDETDGEVGEKNEQKVDDNAPVPPTDENPDGETGDKVSDVPPVPPVDEDGDGETGTKTDDDLPPAPPMDESPDGEIGDKENEIPPVPPVDENPDGETGDKEPETPPVPPVDENPDGETGDKEPETPPVPPVDENPDGETGDKDPDPTDDSEKCSVQGHKYDANGNPLSGWTIGLGEFINGRLIVEENGLVTENFGIVDTKVIDTDVTGTDGSYCLKAESPLPQYIEGSQPFVYEVMQDGWSVNNVYVDGVLKAWKTNSSFDVYVEINLDEETTSVDFFNIADSGNGGGDPTDPDEPTDPETPEVDTPTSGGGGGGGSNRKKKTEGEILGEEIEAFVCSQYLTTYMRMGQYNDPEEVKKLQSFLNEVDIQVPVTGYFGPLTDQAVRELQQTYSDQILKPWIEAGLDHMEPTGYVYKTTQHFINSRVCPNNNFEAPDLVQDVLLCKIMEANMPAKSTKVETNNYNEDFGGKEGGLEASMNETRKLQELRRNKALRLANPNFVSPIETTDEIELIEVEIPKEENDGFLKTFLRWKPIEALLNIGVDIPETKEIPFNVILDPPNAEL